MSTSRPQSLSKSCWRTRPWTVEFALLFLPPRRDLDLRCIAVWYTHLHGTPISHLHKYSKQHVYVCSLSSELSCVSLWQLCACGEQVRRLRIRVAKASANPGRDYLVFLPVRSVACSLRIPPPRPAPPLHLVLVGIYPPSLLTFGAMKFL